MQGTGQELALISRFFSATILVSLYYTTGRPSSLLTLYSAVDQSLAQKYHFAYRLSAD